MVKEQVCAFMILESVFFVYQYLNTVIPLSPYFVNIVYLSCCFCVLFPLFSS